MPKETEKQIITALAVRTNELLHAPFLNSESRINFHLSLVLIKHLLKQNEIRKYKRYNFYIKYGATDTRCHTNNCEKHYFHYTSAMRSESRLLFVISWSISMLHVLNCSRLSSGDTTNTSMSSSMVAS